MSTPTQFAVAPQAPGRLGEDVDSQALLRYLDALGTWRDRRRVELDHLDEACLRSPDRESLTGDVLLSMALWKAVAERYDLLLGTWDSGRVLEAERRRLTTLVWGRLDQRAADGNALAVSLPEACRLSDTLAASLRSRLRLEGSEPDVAHRVRTLRAAVERVRDQVALVPQAAAASARETLVGLDRRLVDVTERARRGADVGGLLGPLENDLATVERDLIVAASQRDRARGDAARARGRRDELVARAEALGSLATRASAQVDPAPRLGIPDPTALGDVPTDVAGVADYLARLDRVARALEVCQRTYAAALEEHDELTGLVGAYGAKIEAQTLPPDVAADLDPLLTRARQALQTRPAPMVRARGLVAALGAYLAAYERPGSGGGS
ncbi:hypothetical protein [Agilicoccus flavus]|uniref:hypothetical protein n=1 Tax=Agilicoccus flavus TaxID=2775968 RepID=UPI001CF6ABAB|nr:hypothetical protein [Agilicoccus flavus]